MANFYLHNNSTSSTMGSNLPWMTTMPVYKDQWIRHVTKDYKTMASVPHMIGSGGVTFMARGRTWSVAPDNPNYETLTNLITSGCMDESRLIGMTSTYEAIITQGAGRLALVEGGLALDGELLPMAWFTALARQADLVPVLLARVGDKVTVQGDEDAPDGVYAVAGVDNADPTSRIYLETEEGFFGYVKSNAIKGVDHEP
jgi:hypothetical protein